MDLAVRKQGAIGGTGIAMLLQAVRYFQPKSNK